MGVTIEPILLEQKSVLIQLIELYMYDFSLYSDADLNDYGYFGYSHIDDYWNEDGRFPYFIKADGKIAGLVFVRNGCEYSELKNPYSIAEFFVMQKYRRRGIGKQAAMKVFDMHQGGWEVSQWAKNLPAQKFWGAVIGEYTKGKFSVFGSLEEGHVGFRFYN